MSDRRSRLLEEMGLAPVWRLRRQDDMRSGPAGAEPDPGQLDPGAGQLKSSRHAIPAPEHQAEERTARILRMDWPQLKAAVASCEACALSRTRSNPVFGVGDERAEWLLVGEAPGAEEDARGEPFVGQAGRLLDNMLASIGLERGSNVYIANVLKCRPPGNRNPEAYEVDQCGAHLERQIALIRPSLIIAMGRFAAQTLLDTASTIAALRGRLHRCRGVPLIVTYHPAYLLRNLPDKAKAWQDLCLARRVMAEIKSKPEGN
jgi:uracil-DNA glycosylase